MNKKLKPRDKITQKMSRDGLIEVNETAGTAELVSGREQDADFSKKPEQAAQEAAQQLPHPSGGAAARPHTPELSPKRDDAAAERVLEHIDAAHTRAASKKAIKRAQREAVAKTKTSRLQFTEEEQATPELQKAIRKSERAADRLDEARAAIGEMTGALPYMDGEMRELALRTLAKLRAMSDADFAALAVSAADEV